MAVFCVLMIQPPPTFNSLYSSAASDVYKRQGGRILTTPAGGRKSSLMPEDLLVVDGTGQVLHGDGAPSSEMPMHLAIYAELPEARAVVHAHPIVASAMAAQAGPLSFCLTAEGSAVLGPVARVPYVRPGTSALGVAVGRACHHAHAILLANHGAVAWDHSVDEALMRMQTLEHVARVVSAARLLGAPTWLPDFEVRALREVEGDSPESPVEVIEVDCSDLPLP